MGKPVLETTDVKKPFPTGFLIRRPAGKGFYILGFVFGLFGDLNHKLGKAGHRTFHVRILNLQVDNDQVAGLRILRDGQRGLQPSVAESVIRGAFSFTI